MKESRKEKFVSIVSQKEAMKHISGSHNSDHGEESDEDLTEELVASVAIILKDMKKAD